MNFQANFPSSGSLTECRRPAWAYYILNYIILYFKGPFLLIPSFALLLDNESLNQRFESPDTRRKDCLSVVVFQNRVSS